MGSGLVTALSLVVVNGTAAVGGAVLARKFGRGAETDGFFVAYAVYLVLVLAASAFRVVVMPRLARAVLAGRLGAEAASYAAALALLAVPALAVSSLAAGPLAGLLTGGLPRSAREAAAHALVWLVPGAVAQLYAGLAASALAAVDNYRVAALGFSAGALAGIALFLALVDAHGTVALAWGLALNGALSLGVPLAELARRGDLRRGDLRRAGLQGLRPAARLGELAQGVALPLALQGLYLVGVRFAGGLGVGRVTSFSYAYLIAAVLVAVTASSLSLVSTVPLARRGLEGDRAVLHVVSTSWLSLTLIAGAAGVAALAGERVAHGILGGAFQGGAGAQLGRLVVYLSPWMVASVGVSVTFPLLFVAGRARWLPVLALAAVAVHVPIEWAGRALFGLAGVAAGLALTTVLVLYALLASLSLATLVRCVRGLGLPTLATGVLAAASFVVSARLLEPIPAALLGLVLYALGLAALRPRGLRRAWAYVRALG